MGPRLKRFLKRVLVVAILLVVAVTTAWLLVRPHLYASLGYALVDEFVRMPPDDTALVEWLKQQPGVVSPHAVQVWREGNALKIDFIQVRNLAGSPPFPSLDQRVKELGYEGGHGFRDDR